jgi:predicted nucleic acid-binding protein
MARFSPVVWWATSVEIHSAISRLHREGEINDAGKRTALGQLEILRDAWQVILSSDEARDRAEILIHQYPLRAADSLQLAAALLWCSNRPAGKTFVSSDNRLCEAAARTGFTVVSP